MFTRYTSQHLRSKPNLQPVRNCNDKPEQRPISSVPRDTLKGLLRKIDRRHSQGEGGAFPIKTLLPWERERALQQYNLQQSKKIDCTRCSPMYDIAIRLVKERIALEETESRADSRELDKIIHISPQSLQLMDTVVIGGEFDIVETVLAWVDIPFVFLRPSEAIKFPFSPNQTVIVNCTEHNYPEDFHEKIRNFVHQGGQLFTSDKALTSIIQEAFPGIMESKGKRLHRTWTRPSHVYVQIPKYQNDHRLLSSLADEPDQLLTWCIDYRSDVVSVKDLNKVNILLSSQKLKLTLGQEGVLFSFNFGQGEVFHSVPHFIVHKFPEEPSYMKDISEKKILEYIKLKKGSQKLVDLTASHLNEFGSDYFSYSGLRAITTSVELLLRVILRQKQKQTGPVILVPEVIE